MAHKKSTTKFARNQASDMTPGLALMEDYWKAEDGEIEDCVHALWDSWPIAEALEGLYELDPALRQLLTPDGDNLTAYGLATLAGRMFLAGECSARNAVPSRSVSTPLPVSDPTAAVHALAQALYALPQGEEGTATYLVDQLENFTRQPDISPATRSVVGQLVGALLALKRTRLVAELKQDTEALLEQTPQDEIDQEVEDILRRSEEEGAA